MDEVKVMACQCAIENMIRRGHISICTIDQILQITGGIPNQEDYKLLSLLHCVDFKDMQPELRRGLPVLLARVVGAEGMKFNDNQIIKLIA